MKTDRLYYHNAYVKKFESTVLERTTVDDQPAVILEQSSFYPTGGGQPYDAGKLNQVAVTDVIAQDEAVIHVLEQAIDDDMVFGEIDWQRRFDHMVHHSGQHILTRAFIETVGAETIGFHLSDQTVTIDLDNNQIKDDIISEAEKLANKIVADNLAIKAWFPPEDELQTLQLRKVSEKITGAVRIVDIGGFDVTACGGTHVAHTGEIGMIKVVRADKRGDKLRIEFLCGSRALDDYNYKNQLLLDLSAQLTTGLDTMQEIMVKTRDENKTLQRQLKATKSELMQFRAEQLWQSAQGQSPTLIAHVFNDVDKNDLQQLASHLAQKVATIALIGIGGEQSHLVFARSEDLDSIDVVPLLKSALATLDTQRGGGRPNMAQGGGVTATTEQVQKAIETARAMLSTTTD